MASFERKVSRNLRCPVCFDLLTDPKQLSCTHTFCKKCLIGILKTSSQNSMTCPICRSKTHVKDGNVLNLKTNVPLKSLIDDVRNSQQLCDLCDTPSRAIYFCCECGKNMCDTCLENHDKWPLNVRHEIVSVEDIREGRVVLKKEGYCQEHKADKQKHICTDVCITCKKFICLRCRMLNHKGHEFQSAEEYNDSVEIEFIILQVRSETKITAIKEHMTCIEAQKKRVSDHITGKKAEINQLYQESIKKLNKRKAASNEQLEALEEKLCVTFDLMKDSEERLMTSIESASVLAGNSLRAPLAGDIIAIRDSLSGELKNVLDRNDPERTCATTLADLAEQVIFKRNNQRDLSIAEIKFVKCELECDVELSKKDSMNGMAATPASRMAVGYNSGGIDIYSPDGQLQQTLLKNVGIRRIVFFSDGRYVVLNDSGITLYTWACEKLDVMFDTLSDDEGGIGSLTVDRNDLIYVGYRKAKKIQVFSPTGGKAIKEIPCDGYEPGQITGYNDSLIIKYANIIRIIDKEGNVKHMVKKSNVYPHVAVTHNKSILIAWVNHDDGLVSISEYTNELKHIQTLISDHKIEKSKRNWYYLQEFRSGEIAFCSPDRLYIFKLTLTSVQV